jgi:hypothetical protein
MKINEQLDTPPATGINDFGEHLPFLFILEKTNESTNYK